MKITIPKKHRGHFPKKLARLNFKDTEHCITKEYVEVFVTRGREGTLLLLNGAEYNQLRENIALVNNNVLTHFVEAGIQNALMTNGEIEIPHQLASWLQGERREFSREQMGILVR